MTETHRIHYAWIICLGGTLMLFTSLGLGVNVFSAFQPYLLEYAGLSNTQGAWIITVRSFFILVGMATANWLVDRLGIRLACTLSLLMLAASSFLFGAVRQFPLYCLAAAMVGLVYSWAGMIPASLLISHWFQDRRALALSIVAAGSGLATIVAPVPFTTLIQTFSLRVSFWTQGTIMLLAAALFWFLVRDRPEDAGLSPYRTSGGEAVPVRPRPAPAGFTPTYQVLVLAAAFLVGAATSLGITDTGVLYSTAGYPQAVVAQLISCMGLCMIVGKISYGQVVDRMGGRMANYIFFGLILIGYALCCLADTGNIPLAFAAMVISGFGLPLCAVSPPVWARDLYGDENYARGLKWVQTIFALGIFVVGPVPGALADWTGSYIPAYAMFWVMLLVSLLLLGWVYARTRAGGRPER